MKGKLLAAVFCVFAVLALCAAPAAAEDSVTDHVIKVSGYGVSFSAPDKVTVSLGVNFTDTNAQNVQKKASDTMKKVTDAVKAAGIKESDIKTNQYSMYSYTVGDYNVGKYPKGTVVYELTSTIQVVSYDVDSIGKVIEKAVAAGANNIGSLQFGLSNEKQKSERTAAIQSAVKAARADADAVADALGIRISALGLITVDQSYNAVSYAPAPMLAEAANDEMMYAKSAVSGAGSISAGELSTTATVSVVYLY